MSAQEAQNLPPIGRRYLSQFASDLDSAIRETADSAGLLDDYTEAINN